MAFMQPIAHLVEAKTRVLAVHNLKGGVGKTTSVINLAAALAYSGRRVLLVGGDPQKNTTDRFIPGARGVKYDLRDVVVEGVPITDAIIPTRVPNLDLLPESDGLAAFGRDLDAMRARREDRVKWALEPLVEAGTYDYILFDLDSALETVNIAILVAVDGIIAPLPPGVLELQSTVLYYERLKEFRELRTITAPIIGVLLTMVEAGPFRRVALDIVQEVLELEQFPLFQTWIPNRAAVQDQVGQRVVAGDPDTPKAMRPVCEGYKAAANQLIRNAEPAGAPLAPLLRVHQAEADYLTDGWRVLIGKRPVKAGEVRD